MQITKTQAIKNLLIKLTHKDLADLYNINMEVQVNVAQDNGERIDGEYRGKYWHGWTDNITTWKSFRIPWNAATDPTYEDKIITFDLAAHAEGIGMTGWDWKNKLSRWVAFDFDSIVEHKQGLSTNELKIIEDEASKIPWVTVRSSTGGNGIHFYIFLDPPIETDNHNEHAAFARALLGQLSAITGFDFINKVDICGGNMWVWHRKMKGLEHNSLKLIKQGEPFRDKIKNWRDHIKVITGRRKRNLPQDIESQSNEVDKLFDELTGQSTKEKLDEEHKRLINYFKDNNCLWWWDQDNNILVTHTFHLRDAHEGLNLKGIFKTTSSGTSEHNCFCFPIRKGGWVVRRFSLGVSEHESWDQDGSGWTRCFFNTDPNLSTACRTYDGVEHPTGGYVFREAELAQKSALVLGADLKLPNFMQARQTKLKSHKDGKLLVEITKENHDPPEKMVNWIPEGTKWKRVFNIQLNNNTDNESKNYDDLIRHLTSQQNTDCGWVVQSDSIWVQEPITHVRLALQSLGLKNTEVASVLGSNIFKRWKIVNKPFQPEYPGDRQWNRDSCQLQYYPSTKDDLHYPTWLKLITHIGSNLTPAIENFDWAKNNNILTGADYLKCWLASVFQKPEEPLPYLFLFGPEATGKTVFHEAISLLITSTGYQRAEVSLQSQQGFNYELLNAIICVVEEVNLSQKNKLAYTRIKDWVTSELIPIHPKGGTPFLATNTTHWIQCSNDITFCPVFPGDTRITMIYVDAILKEHWESKRDIFIRLRKEAPDFLGELMRLELPVSPDRLNVPVISTTEKMLLQKQNQDALETFIDEQCFTCPGYTIKFSEFYEAFVKWLDPAEAYNWSKHRLGKSINLPYVKGRLRDSQFYIGNISFQEEKESRKMLTVIDGKLSPK